MQPPGRVYGMGTVLSIHIATQRGAAEPGSTQGTPAVAIAAIGDTWSPIRAKFWFLAFGPRKIKSRPPTTAKAKCLL